MILRRHSRISRQPHRGLSLLEVLLSLAILALALVAIGRLVDIGTQRGNEARAYSRGARLAQAKMAEVEAGIIPLDSESSGQFDGDDAAWTFTVTPDAAGPPNLYNVTVRVTRDIQGKPVEIALSQLIFDPSLMGSAAQAEQPATDSSSSGSGTGTGSGMGMGGTSP